MSQGLRLPVPQERGATAGFPRTGTGPTAGSLLPAHRGCSSAPGMGTALSLQNPAFSVGHNRPSSMPGALLGPGTGARPTPAERAGPWGSRGRVPRDPAPRDCAVGGTRKELHRAWLGTLPEEGMFIEVAGWSCVPTRPGQAAFPRSPISAGVW